MQVRVVYEAEHGSVRERGLVEGVEEVDGEHEREESEVDAAQDAGVVGGGYPDALGRRAAELDEHLGGGIAVQAILVAGSRRGCRQGRLDIFTVTVGEGIAIVLALGGERLVPEGEGPVF